MGSSGSLFLCPLPSRFRLVAPEPWPMSTAAVRKTTAEGNTSSCNDLRRPNTSTEWLCAQQARSREQRPVARNIPGAHLAQPALAALFVFETEAPPVSSEREAFCLGFACPNSTTKLMHVELHRRTHAKGVDDSRSRRALRTPPAGSKPRQNFELQRDAIRRPLLLPIRDSQRSTRDDRVHVELDPGGAERAQRVSIRIRSSRAARDDRTAPCNPTSSQQ